MKFPKLSITNFLAITEAELALSDRGLVLIRGENEVNTAAMSNGAGKSTLMDALCWAIFGTTARGMSGDDVINRKAAKGTIVTVTVQDGPMTYTISRHRKHKTGKNSLTVSSYDGLRTVELTKGTDKLTQDVVNQIIGSSHEVFTGAIYAGQEKMPDLPAMTDKALKMLIEEAAGVLVLEAAYEKARADMRAVQVDLENAERGVEGFVATLRWTDEQIEEAKIRTADWNTNRDSTVAALKNTVATETVPKLKAVMAELGTKDRAGIEAKIAACDAKLGAVKGEQEEMSRLESDLVRKNAATKSANSQLEGCERLFKIASTEVTNISHKLGCPCTECGRPLTEKELEAADKAARAREDAARDAVGDAEIALRDAAEDEKAAIEARDTFRASLTDVSAVAAERSALAGQLAEIDQLVATQTVLTNEARAMKVKIEETLAAVNPHQAHLDGLIAKRAVNAKDHTAAVEEKRRVEKRLAVEQEVVKIYGPAGVRARILDEVTPFLNAQTAKYLSTLTDGAIDAVWSTVQLDSKGNPKEKFAIDVTSAEDAGKFGGFSGGEKRKIRIAAALALQDLVATRATKPIDLFIGDEIDDALDPAGIERLTLVLEEKARERGSVFIISHNEIQDHVRNVMTIKKTPTGTKITEVAA